MRFIKSLPILLAISLPVFPQSDRGNITGTIADAAGAVVANASIQARNIETGSVLNVVSTGTGNYTLSQLPAGNYELSVSVPGFKKYVRPGLAVQVAQTLRVDVKLDIGAVTDSVTVTESSPLLKTESGELSYNVATATLDSLPISNVSSGGVRSPYATTQLVPGATWQSNLSVRINGAPSNTESMRIEGQDSTNGLWATTPAMTQPSIDSIQEFAIQASNYAAEFGQAGGGIFNVTMKSGTNQLHGSAYEYSVNDAYNAEQPFVNALPVRRRNDYGFTVGGPVWIPKVYNGKDKSFFFVNWERYKDTQTYNNIFQTVPIDPYRAGDFSQALTGRSLGTDTAGTNIIEGMIFDPLTGRIVNGATVRSPFPANAIPLARMDPVAVAIQNLIPEANVAGGSRTNNFLPVFVSPARTLVPSIKFDQLIGAKSKVSFYWSMTDSSTTNLVGFGQADGMPNPITQARGSFTTANTYRLSFDHTLSPTLLAHVGVGFVGFSFLDDSPTTNFSDASIGLPGVPQPNGRFPYITGLTTTNGTGGMINMGPLAQSSIHEDRPTANASVTWVHGNHTSKFGADMIIDGYPSQILGASVGFFNFSNVETSTPYLIGKNTGAANAGFNYASFLLGALDNGNIGLPAFTHLGSHSLAFFAQDSWKVTRKFTLDYGLRYDYQTYLKDGYGRMPSFGFDTPNPSAGGRLGALIFEGPLDGRCGCDFASNYPFAFGPRLGAAYQITPKTVFRAGFGVTYSKTGNNAFTSQFISSNNTYGTANLGAGNYAPIGYLQNGPPVVPVWPNFSPGQQPAIPGSLGAAPSGGIVDPNAGRPARQLQWSIGLQREILRDLAVEASYVGNRGAWWQANGLVDYNRLTPAILSQYNIDLNNPSDLALLTTPFASASPAALASKGIGLPYVGFPTNQTVAQALRPYPQFGALPTRWAPLGDTWYDALQLKVIKRTSHGLDFMYNFSYQKELTIGAESEDNTGFLLNPGINDVLNRSLQKTISGLSQPLSSVVALNYRTPIIAGANRIVSWGLRDWTVGVLAEYRSGLPILSPAASNQLTGPAGSQLLTQATTYMNRTGQPLYLVDINCHCYDPSATQILNPAAWTNPAPGQFGTSAPYYNDFRYQRRPVENFTFGRAFRLKEKASLSLRAEFANVFNRSEPPNPQATNVLVNPSVYPNGNFSSGFGTINTLGTPVTAPRQGTLVVRIQF